MSVSRVIMVTAVAGVLVVEPARGQDQKAAVVSTVQATFDAMGVRDTNALKTLLHPKAHLVATLESGDSTVVRVSTRDEFIAQIARAGPRPLERMWDPEVRVSGGIATLWAPYDFHTGTTFSHCGIDSVHLARTPSGWQITSIIYTVVRPADRCPPSPLGASR